MIIQAVFFSLVQHKTLTHLLPPLALKYMDGTNEVNEPTQEHFIKVVLIRNVLDYQILKITGWSAEISLFGLRILYVCGKIPTYFPLRYNDQY